MTNALLNHELQGSNNSAITVTHRVFLRHPWKTWALSTWNHAKHVLQIAGFAAVLVILIPPAPAHAQSLHSMEADVPFEFTIGTQTFNAGHYQLVPTPTGMLQLRDSQSRVVAALFARSVEAKGQVAASKLVFHLVNGHQQLQQIWFENPSQGLKIVREQLVTRSPKPAKAPAASPDAL